MSIELVLPENVDLSKLLDELRKLSWAAADVLKAYARGDEPPYGFPRYLSVEEGGDGPVSAADLAVNKLLVSGLQAKFPFANWDVLSEENSKETLLKNSQLTQDWKWILDPLDGTKDFLQGSENYAVHLALVFKKRPKIGIVLIPERDELWFGIIGSGSWLESRNGSRKNISFSNRKEISKLILVSSRNHQELQLQNLILEMDFGETKRIGSVGCKIASILRGESDVYISLSGKSAPKDWDMAAPHAIIEAAGGLFTHADGRSLSYQKSDYSQRGCLVASHGKSHQKICEKVMKFFSEAEPEYQI